MKLLLNPLVIKLGFAFVIIVALTLVAMLMMRRLKSSIAEEGAMEERPSRETGLELHAYNAVIQELKQQKHELQAQQRLERRRTQVSERVNATVLANLPCGVLFFNAQGLVKQANAAAKEILGFESPVGLNAGQVFAGAAEPSRDSEFGEWPSLPEAVMLALKTGSEARELEVGFRTPAARERAISVRLVPIMGVNQEVLGATALITEMTHESANSDPSREVLESSQKIAGWAEQLRGWSETEEVHQLAESLAKEAGVLQHWARGQHSLAKGAAAAPASSK